MTGPVRLGTAGVAGAAGPRLAAILLGAACVAWTAIPLRTTGLAGTALVVSIAAVTAGALRLALADVPQPEDEFFLAAPMRAWLTFLGLLRALPWEEIAVVAIVWLEVQHPARPWYTAALGAGLVAYLLAVHIAESGAPARLLRRQGKVLFAGACLVALGGGFGTLSAAGPGAGSALLRVLAAVAVVAAAALVLPGRD
jgi:hypothetical protein